MGHKDTLRDAKVGRCPECGAHYPEGTASCPLDGQPLRAETWDPSRGPLAGTVVGGRYEVQDPLGEGGVGVVYRVRHVGLDRLFAMKVLRPELASDKALCARFVQEARATAAIKHPGVVSISDFGDLDDGTPYLVMELLTGVSLAERLRSGGPLPPRAAAEASTKIASALAASHAAGIIHRDLKPENVFLVGQAPSAPESEVRIVDFGAAKVASGTKLTRPGMVFGTPHYMSPEQAGGQEVDARSDVYSLGVLLFEMLTGKVPFEADTYMGVLTKHMFTEAAPPSEHMAPGAPLGALDSVVLRAMAKDPKARFQSMDAFVEALRTSATAPALPAMKGTVRMAGLGPMLGGPRPPSFADRMERAADQVDRVEGRRRAAVVAVSVLLTLIVVALVTSVVVGRRTRGDRARPASSPAASSPVVAPPPPEVPAAPPEVAPPKAAAAAPSAVVRFPAAATRTPAPLQTGAPAPASAARPPGHDFADPWKH